MIAGLIEWRIQFDFHSKSIGFIHSSFISVIIQFSSIFLCCNLFLFNKAKSISYFSINDYIVLSIYWTMDSQMWIIINKYQSIRTIPLCYYQSNLLDYSKQPVCYQYWTNPISNHHLIMIGRLESLPFVIVQYVMVGSLVITMMMMIEMNGWLIETTILIQYHCKNGKEKQHNQAGRIDILKIIESCIGIKNLFETNKQSINQSKCS